MRNIKTLVCITLLLISVTSIAAGQSHSQVILDVFADSTLSETLEHIKSDYEANHLTALNLHFGTSDELSRTMAETKAGDVLYFDGLDVIDDSQVCIASKNGISDTLMVHCYSRNAKPSAKFTAYLTGDDAGAIFTKEGFSRMNTPAARQLKPSKSKTKQK